jgi:hypothetical protein
MRKWEKLFVKDEGNRTLVRPSCRCDYNIKSDLAEMKLQGFGSDSCGSSYVPVAGFCKRGNEHSGSIKGGEFLPDTRRVTVIFLRKTLFRGGHKFLIAEVFND